MRKAVLTDKEKIIEILKTSFQGNKSIDFVVKQDSKRDIRTKLLMEYSFYKGMNYGEVFISEDEKACCILLRPEKEKLTLSSILWDIKLLFHCIGIENLFKVLKREKLLKKNHPKTKFIHLWYIGVLPKYQGQKKGSDLAKKIFTLYEKDNIYLETSTYKNLPFYERLGFKIINKLNLGYDLYVLKK